MKYLQVKSSSKQNKSESYIFIKSTAGTKKLPDNWTLEFFLNSTIASSNTEDLPIFDLKLKETSTAEVTSPIQIYVSASDSNQYVFKIGEKTKIISEAFLYRVWDHIAIVWAKDCSVIIYINGNPVIGTNMSELSFKDYAEFNRFLFTTYKSVNTVCFAGIKVYESIKYNSSGFSINYPVSTASTTTIITGSTGRSIGFVNNDANEDKNILVIDDPDIITRMTDNLNDEVIRMDFSNPENVLKEEYRRYTNIHSGNALTSDSVEITDLDREIYYDLYDIRYRFSQMLRVKSNFTFYIDVDLGALMKTGVSIDLLARHTNQTSSSELISYYRANSDGTNAILNNDGISINSNKVSTMSIYEKITGNTSSTSIGSLSINRTLNNNKFIHYLHNMRCGSSYETSDSPIYRFKRNGIENIDSSYITYLLNINNPSCTNYFNLYCNAGIYTIRIFVSLKSGDYLKLFRISKNNLFGGSFDPSFYLFGPMIINNINIESKDNDKTNLLNNIQLLYPANPSTQNIYERSHSDDVIHTRNYYFIMESTSTTDIEFTTQLSGTGYPSEYSSYPAVITKSVTRERNLIKFRCPYPVYSSWTFECWIYLKTNNLDSSKAEEYCDLLYLSGLQYGYIGLKIMPKTGDIKICYDKLNSYSSNVNTMTSLQNTVSNGNYIESPIFVSTSTLNLNGWNHIAITCSKSSLNSYSSAYGTVKVYTNGILIQSITNFMLAYLHRIFLFTKSLSSCLIPAYTGVKVIFNSAKTSFDLSKTV